MGQTIVDRVIDALQAVAIRADEAYPGGRIPALTGPVAAVRLGKVDWSVRTTAVQVTVMSPSELGGAICETTALRAMAALQEIDGTCQKGLCQFDNVADVFYTEITVEFFGTAMEDTWSAGPGFAITIGAQAMKWATGFSSARKIGGDVTALSGAKWEFTLEELMGPGSVDPPDPVEPFVLTVVRGNGEEIYFGCTWTSVSREDTLKGIRQVRGGVATARAISGVL